MGASRGLVGRRDILSFDDCGVGFVDCGGLLLKHGVKATKVGGFPAGDRLVALNALLQYLNVTEHFLGYGDGDPYLVQPLILRVQDLEAEECVVIADCSCVFCVHVGCVLVVYSSPFVLMKAA